MNRVLSSKDLVRCILARLDDLSAFGKLSQVSRHFWKLISHLDKPWWRLYVLRNSLYTGIPIDSPRLFAPYPQYMQHFFHYIRLFRVDRLELAFYATVVTGNLNVYWIDRWLTTSLFRHYGIVVQGLVYCPKYALGPGIVYQFLFERYPELRKYQQRWHRRMSLNMTHRWALLCSLEDRKDFETFDRIFHMKAKDFADMLTQSFRGWNTFKLSFFQYWKATRLTSLAHEVRAYFKQYGRYRNDCTTFVQLSAIEPTFLEELQEK